MITVDNKFELDQQVFMITKEHKKIEKKETCSVDIQPHTITSYRYSVTRNGNSLKYRLDGDKNVSEDMIFVTRKEAENACDDLNMFVTYDELGKRLLEQDEQKELEDSTNGNR